MFKNTPTKILSSYYWGHQKILSSHHWGHQNVSWNVSSLLWGHDQNVSWNVSSLLWGHDQNVSWNVSSLYGDMAQNVVLKCVFYADMTTGGDWKYKIQKTKIWKYGITGFRKYGMVYRSIGFATDKSQMDQTNISISQLLDMIETKLDCLQLLEFNCPDI